MTAKTDPLVGEDSLERLRWVALRSPFDKLRANRLYVEISDLSERKDHTYRPQSGGQSCAIANDGDRRLHPSQPKVVKDMADAMSAVKER